MEQPNFNLLDNIFYLEIIICFSSAVLVLLAVIMMKKDHLQQEVI